jgi:hypothetical protein
MLAQSSNGRTYTRDARAPYAETLMPRWKKLTTGSIPAPFHFSNFEETVSDRSDVRTDAGPSADSRGHLPEGEG